MSCVNCNYGNKFYDQELNKFLKVECFYPYTVKQAVYDEVNVKRGVWNAPDYTCDHFTPEKSNWLK